LQLTTAGEYDTTHGSLLFYCHCEERSDAAIPLAVLTWQEIAAPLCSSQ
jgi:hypothetical protein